MNIGYYQRMSFWFFAVLLLLSLTITSAMLDFHKTLYPVQTSCQSCQLSASSGGTEGPSKITELTLFPGKLALPPLHICPLPSSQNYFAVIFPGNLDICDLSFSHPQEPVSKSVSLADGLSKLTLGFLSPSFIFSAFLLIWLFSFLSEFQSSSQIAS